MADITVIGSFVMDIVAKMQRFPQQGESVIGSSVNTYPGGKGINQCVSASRLGGSVQMIGMLGKDQNAKVFRDIMQRENIKSDYVFSCNEPTAIAQVQIDASGQNRICVVPSANYCFTIDQVNKIDEQIKNSKLIVLQLELQIEVVKEIIKRAKNYGVPILLNPAPAHFLDENTLYGIDYITPNQTELEFLTQMQTQTVEQCELACKKLLNKGVKNVIATLGDMGALIVNKQIRQLVKGYKVTPIDTVGAGDSFNGALAVALLEGKSLIQSVEFANAMGAVTVQKEGAIPSICTREVLEKFIIENK